MLKRLLLAIFILLLSGAVFFIVLTHKFTESYTLPQQINIVIPKGTGLNQTALMLEQHKIIADAKWFMLYARLHNLTSHLKAGEYAFSGVVSLTTIANKLKDGDVIVHALTIPEGKALAEIKQIVENNPYLTGKITLTLKEGEILPETYHFTRGETRDNFLKKAKQAMKKELKKAYNERDKNIPIKSEQELLTLASLIEKETGINSERAKVASVFVNRLNLDMRLQTDPTVIYAVTNGKLDLKRPLTRKDLAYDSPYNTYINKGLPPTAICSPGKASLHAAAHPETTKYLYFVADGKTGGHRFAKTLNEHNANVTHYRKALKQKK